MVQITDKPRESTLQFFNEILENSTNSEVLNGKCFTTKRGVGFNFGLL